MLERLFSGILGFRMRYRLQRPGGGVAPLRRDEGLLSSTIPAADDLAVRARITPARLARIIVDADAGEPQEQARLMEIVLEKEPRFAAHLATRRLAVLGCKWAVHGEDEPELAAEVETMLRDAGARDAMGALLRCVGFGYAGVAADWAPGGAAVTGFHPVAQDRWIFDESGAPALECDDGTRRALASFHPAQVLYCQADGMAGLPARNGLLRTLLWLYLFKNTSFTLWNQFLERFGVPFILGKLPSGDFNDLKKRAELLQSILAVRSGGGGVGTVETDMQMLNGASGSNHDAFERFQRYCDETATLVILGQLATSSDGGGLSGDNAQDKVRQDILEADCALVSAEFQKLVDWLVRFRTGREDHGLRFEIDCAKPEDMNVRAERDARVATAAGCVLERKYAEETYGLRLEERPPAPADPMAGFSDLRRPSGPTARDRAIASICEKAVTSLVEDEALEAWRGPVDDAIARAFGDIDPSLPDDELLAAFADRAPAFLASLPGVMDAIDDRALTRAFAESMLAGYLDGLLPPSFWAKRGKKANFQKAGGKAK